jgi:hypothetical protein
MGVEVPGEYPKEPDLVIKNDGEFYGEAKWDSKYWEGITDARDYEQIPTANGTFAIGYPDALKSEVSQSRLGEEKEEAILSGHKFRVSFFRPGEDAEMDRLEIQELPQWIENHIHRRVEPEPEPDEVVWVLRQTADALSEQLEEADAPELFKNVMGVEPEKNEEKQAAQRAAGYLLVNQIAFYRVLSSVKEYPQIEPDSIDRPKDLNNYFQRVLLDDYSAIFSFPVAKAYPQEEIRILRNAIKSIYQLSPERIDHEVLGTVFHSLTPLTVRKPLAAFYSKNRPSQLLAVLAVDDGDAKIIDPACGSGNLLSAAYRRKRQLTDGFDEQDHKRFVGEEITGIDIMPFASHLSTIHLALEAPAYETDKVQIGIEDATKLQPGKTISPISQVLPESIEGQQSLDKFHRDMDENWVEEEKVERGAVNLTAMPQQEIEIGESDVVIMNPPFSRQETVSQFSAEYKQKLRDRFSEYEDAIHGKMSYCSYFILLADRLLKDDGTLAAILPASFLTKSSDEKIRDLLFDNYDVQYLLARDDEPNFSEDTDFREILLVAQKNGSKDNSSIAYVTIDGFGVTSEQIENAAEELATDEINSSESRTITRDGTSATIRRFKTKEIRELNLFSPFAVNNYSLFDVWDRVTSGENLAKLDTLDSGLIRGVGSHDWQEGLINHPGAKLRNKDIWVHDSEDENNVTARHRVLDETIKIGHDKLVYDLHRYAGRPRFDHTNLDEYAVIEEPEDNRFLQLSEEKEVPAKWRQNVSNNLDNRLAHLAFLRRPDLTAPGTHHLAYFTGEKRLFHAMWAMPDFTEGEAQNVGIWMDSSLNLLQMMFNRQPRRGGLAKYEKHTISEFDVLNPDDLDEDDNEELSEIFKSIQHIEYPPIFQQLVLSTPSDILSEEEIERLSKAFQGMESELGNGFTPRRRIDRAMLEIIGVEQPEELLDELYPALLNELVTLKIMMQA